MQCSISRYRYGNCTLSPSVVVLAGPRFLPRLPVFALALSSATSLLFIGSNRASRLGFAKTRTGGGCLRLLSVPCSCPWCAKKASTRNQTDFAKRNSNLASSCSERGCHRKNYRFYMHIPHELKTQHRASASASQNFVATFTLFHISQSRHSPLLTPSPS